MPWKYAVVCSSNMNRSMEAHNVLKQHGLNVQSYGTGTNVRLPGPSADRPNVYDFGTPYSQILESLKSQNAELYQHIGLIPMLERNVRIKKAPERWQEEKERFDVAISFEERVFEAIVQDLQSRESEHFMPMLVFNLETKDNHEEAAAAAKQAVILCQLLEKVEDLEAESASFADAAQEAIGKPLLYTVLYT